jgi:hypothetical protein
MYARRLIYTFSIAVALNYIWEILQAPLFVGMGAWNQLWWHCFFASLGDGTIVVLISLFGWFLFKKPTWYIRPTLQSYLMMSLAGAACAIVVEKFALALDRWAYSPQMPVIPTLEVGLVPVLQMLVLPPIIFKLVRKVG